MDLIRLMNNHHNMDYFIPTYKRPHIIITHTLELLHRLKVPQENIFVIVGCDNEDDYYEYFFPINELYPNVSVLVGDNSNYKASQLNFIRQELLYENQLACIMDDDIEDILIMVNNKLHSINPDEYDKLISTGCNLLRGYRVELMGINSTGNPFYMSDKVKLCKSCICGGFQVFFNDPNLNISINQGEDAYTSCWYIDKCQYNLKWDFITLKTKLFTDGGLKEYRDDLDKVYNDYLSVAVSYPQYVSYYTWNIGEDYGFDKNGKKIKIPISRKNKINIELKWLRTKSIAIRCYDDF